MYFIAMAYFLNRTFYHFHIKEKKKSEEKTKQPNMNPASLYPPYLIFIRNTVMSL